MKINYHPPGTSPSPEQMAYAMARYSRSSMTLQESLRFIASGEAEGDSAEERTRKFLERNYLAYGHGSIADMAVAAFSIDNVSILAAQEIEDEYLWSGQERSTRYQDAAEWGWYPYDSVDYTRHMEKLLEKYTSLCNQVFFLFQTTYPYPLATLRARAMDVARMYLPYGLLTSLGQIISARTMERQVARLETSSLEELRLIGQNLREAGRIPFPTIMRDSRSTDSKAKELLRDLQGIKKLLLPPTVPGGLIDKWPGVTLHIAGDSIVETLATFLYESSDSSYEVCLEYAKRLPGSMQRSIYKTLQEIRKAAPWNSKALETGKRYIFEVTTDGKALQDLRRHRPVVKIPKSISWNTRISPDWIQEGTRELWRETADLTEELTRIPSLPEAIRPYAVPMGALQSCLFKMDLEEARWIISLRSKPQGHFSYRWAANEMARELEKLEPGLIGTIPRSEMAVSSDEWGQR